MSVEDGPDLFGRTPFVIAHRGGAGEAPENTSAAFRRAITAGFPWVECDVRALADGTPAVVHDAHVYLPGRDEPALVADLDRRAFAAADLARTHGAAAATERPLLLGELLALPFGTTGLMLEVKSGPREEDLAVAAAAAALASLGRRRLVVASFSRRILEVVARFVPGAALMGLLDTDTPDDAFVGLPIAAVGAPVAAIDRARVAAWSGGGVAVWSWTVKSLREVGPLLAAGVRGLITDYPTAVSARLSRERN
jgi:glycerophosphoryl diester phosphodiesterase